ncbi:MAG: glutamate 5-kinase [Lachnospiraceae bacterium]|nr:glutamate 5-kinase [Ruminococcus sp.]MCM1275741.1 glutamate 5-kinase [Lachnospiraceae bacterium]
MQCFADKKRVVVKVGSSTLAYPETGSLNIRKSRALVEVLADLKNSGREIVFVSSGAQCVGAAKGGFRGKPRDIPSKQACAAIGQSELMKFYSDAFGQYNHNVAQLLLTRDVISNETRRTNVINTFNKLFELGVMPIINANDVVSIEHLDFDENDTLSATVAALCGADLLVMLTDVDGLYDGDPSEEGTKLVREVDAITTEVITMARGTGSAVGTGGMLTKIEAAKIATEAGIDTVIIGNKDPKALYKLFESGDAVCTWFKALKD